MEPGHREVTLRWHSSPGGCGQHTALSGWLCCPSVLPVTPRGRAEPRGELGWPHMALGVVPTSCQCPEQRGELC